MLLNNKIEDLDPDVALTYREAKAAWIRDHPLGPRPELNETARSKAVQDAYYSRTRKPAAEVQRLYKLAGLYEIDATEAKTWATNAAFGQSSHNAAADEYSGAGDVRFRLYAKGQPAGITWDDKYYIAFAAYMLRAAVRLKGEGKITDKIVWGGDWDGDGLTSDEHRPDFPHYERKSWRLGRRKKASIAAVK